MSITLEFPLELEHRLRKADPNLDLLARQAVALDLFRNEKITHYELGQLLGLDRFETDSFLKAHHEYAQTLTLTDIEDDRRTIKQLLGDLNHRARFSCAHDGLEF